MKAISALFISAILIPAPVCANGIITRITIKGANLAAPVEITDAVIKDFTPWAGPGVTINGIKQTEGFIIDWNQGPLSSRPTALPRYEVSFYGKLYGQPFGVDVAFGDPILGEPETVTAEDTLAFASVAPPTLRLYPIETHIAEKLHAYTLPRHRTNTRVKDLPDIALLGAVRPLHAERLRMAFAQTFEFRGTHAAPSSVPDPPASWSTPYRELARENELAWTTLEDLTVAVGAFLNPVLAGKSGTWRPMEWRWS